MMMMIFFLLPVGAINDVIITDCSYSPQLLLVSDRNVVLLVHDLVLTLVLPTSPSADSASVINELKISKYVGDGVHVRQAVVIHTDYKSISHQFTVAVWTSNDDLCILDNNCDNYYNNNKKLFSAVQCTTVVHSYKH